MEEKILQTKKNGMVMLLLTLLGYVVFTALFINASLILLDTSLFPGILLMARSASAARYRRGNRFPSLQPGVGQRGLAGLAE